MGVGGQLLTWQPQSGSREMNAGAWLIFSFSSSQEPQPMGRHHPSLRRGFSANEPILESLSQPQQGVWWMSLTYCADLTQIMC